MGEWVTVPFYRPRPLLQAPMIFWESGRGSSCLIAALVMALKGFGPAVLLSPPPHAQSRRHRPAPRPCRHAASFALDSSSTLFTASSASPRPPRILRLSLSHLACLRIRRASARPHPPPWRCDNKEGPCVRFTRSRHPASARQTLRARSVSPCLRGALTLCQHRRPRR